MSGFAAEPVVGTAGAGRPVRWLALLSLLLVFVAGGAVGWGLASRYAARPGGWSGDRPPGPGRGRRGEMLLDAGPMARYQLTAVQRTRVDSVLTARRAQIDAFWGGPGRELRTILDSTASDVRAVLTPTQQATFDAARAEHQRRIRERFRGGGRRGLPPGPPPGPSGP